MSPRRWIVASGTTLQELDRELRNRAPEDGSVFSITIRAYRGIAGSCYFVAELADGIAHRSRFLNAAIDDAIARHDEIKAAGRAA